MGRNLFKLLQQTAKYNAKDLQGCNCGKKQSLKDTIIISIKNHYLWASRVAQWLRVLYCSASCAIRDSGFAPRLCRNRPRPGGPWGDAQLAYSVVQVREGLVGRDVLVSSRTSDSCGGPGAVLANQGCQVHGVASDTLVRLASGLDGAVLRSSAARLGCVSEDA